MNSKILIAFAGGLILASGITYFAMKSAQPEGAQPVQTAQAAQPASSPAPAAETTAPDPATTAATPVVEPKAPAPSRPSPIVRPKLREVPLPPERAPSPR